MHCIPEEICINIYYQYVTAALHSVFGIAMFAGDNIWIFYISYQQSFDFLHTTVKLNFLGAFALPRKEVIEAVTPVCVFVRPIE